MSTRIWAARRSIAGPIALVLALTFGTSGVPAAGSTPPNIVLILTDDQRWDTIDRMPAVRAGIVDKGVRFTNGFVVNSLCCPSRASILTGAYSHTTDVYRNKFPHGGFDSFDDTSTIGTWLQAAGYHTGYVGKYLNGYNEDYVPPGWDDWEGATKTGARTAYYNYTINSNGTLVRYGNDPADYSTDVFGSLAETFIRNAPASEPLFLQFAPRAPHSPATPAPRHGNDFSNLEDYRPPNYDEPNVSDKPAYVRGQARLTPAEKYAVDEFRIDQYRTLKAVDEAIAAILDALADTQRLSTTMIVFASDNGLTWAEHRLRLRKMVPYEESIRVPMVVRYDPLTSTPRTDSHLVLNIDLAPTFADLAGVPAPRADGSSLLPLLQAPDPPWRSDFLIEHMKDPSVNNVSTYCAVRNETALYVDYVTGEEELYDLSIDPYQLSNKVEDPGYASELQDMRQRMIELCDPPPPADLSIVVDPPEVRVGDPVSLYGTLVVPIRGTSAGQTIHLSRTNPDGSNTPLPDVITDGDGGWVSADTLPVAGLFEYAAFWEGDGTHEAATSVAPLTVRPAL